MIRIEKIIRRRICFCKLLVVLRKNGTDRLIVIRSRRRRIEGVMIDSDPIHGPEEIA